MPPSDPELVRQALAGDQDAYRTLVARYAGRATNLAMRMVRDRALAEDLAQEAFTRAFARLASYGQDRRFSAWFFQVLHNVVIDHVRRKRLPLVSLDELDAAGHPGLSSQSPADSPAALAEQGELSRALASALDGLRPEYREAVVLRYQEEIPVQEIAEIMAIPEGTVKTYLFRARKEMAVRLSAAGLGRGDGPA